MDNFIVIGSDAEDVPVQILNNGVAVDLSNPTEFPYDEVEIYLIDRYGREFARYKTPTTPDFHPLDITTDPVNGNILFDILKEDSVNFTKGELYAQPYLIDTTRAGFTDGFRQGMDKVYLGECIKNKI